MSLNQIVVSNPTPLNVEFNDVVIDGTLTIDGNIITSVDSGQYASGITGEPATLSNLVEQSAPIYSRIGSVVTITGSWICDPLQDQVRVTINLPPGTSNANANISAIVTGNKIAEISYTGTAFTVVGGTQLLFFVNTVNNATIVPVNATATAFNYYVSFVSTS